MSESLDFDFNHLARMCHYAQDHVECFDPGHRENVLEPTSYVVACFFAQKLNDGIEWEVVYEKLCGKMISIEEWEVFLKEKFKELDLFLENL
jgi:hypothetical protein